MPACERFPRGGTVLDLTSCPAVGGKLIDCPLKVTDMKTCERDCVKNQMRFRIVVSLMPRYTHTSRPPTCMYTLNQQNEDPPTPFHYIQALFRPSRGRMLLFFYNPH